MDQRTALHTERLVLRPPEPADAGWIAAEISRPEVQRMLTTPPHPYTVADAECWIDENRRLDGNFVIVANGDPVGVVTLKSAAWGRELGYWLATDAWGHGFMTEAARAVLARYFSASGDAVPSGHITDNLASRSVLRKLGFEDQTIESRPCKFRGEDVNVQRMILTREAWETRNGD